MLLRFFWKMIFGKEICCDESRVRVFFLFPITICAKRNIESRDRNVRFDYLIKITKFDIILYLRTTNQPKLRSIIFENESGTLSSNALHASSTKSSACF